MTSSPMAEFVSPSDTRIHEQINDWKCSVQMMPGGLLLVAIGALASDEEIIRIADTFGLDADAMIGFRDRSTPRKWNLSVTLASGQRSLIRCQAPPGDAEIIRRFTLDRPEVVNADLVADDEK